MRDPGSRNVTVHVLYCDVHVLYCVESGEKGHAYTLMTSKDNTFAGDLVRNLEQANQNIPEDLMKLAMTVCFCLYYCLLVCACACVRACVQSILTRMCLLCWQPA